MQAVITYDALACYAVHNRKSARISNSCSQTVTHNSRTALKAVPTQQQQHHNVTHYNSSNILIAIFIQAIYVQQHSHRHKNTCRVTHNGSKNTYRILKLGWGNDGKVQVTITRYLAT